MARGASRVPFWGPKNFQDSLCFCVCISINAEHCKLTTLRFESKRRVVNLQCSALIEMGVVVVKWSEFCYVGYVRHSCIKMHMYTHEEHKQ